MFGSAVLALLAFGAITFAEEVAVPEAPAAVEEAALPEAPAEPEAFVFESDTETAVEEEEEQSGESFSFSARVVEEIVLDDDTIYQGNSLEPKCEESSPMEWHWIINGLDSDAPEEITVYFENAGEVVVPLEKVTGPTAHYTWLSNLGDILEEPGASAEYDGGYNNFNLSHGPCIVPLEIEKTASTSYDREWTWDIEKSADQDDLGILDAGETETVNYEITVSADGEEVDHTVFGTITIHNPASNPEATLESIVDELDEEGVIDIDCGDIDFPYVMDPDETLECTYSTDSDGDDTLNTVTVTTSGSVEGGDATADVVWVDPADIIDECITVDDTNTQGPQDEEVCSDDLNGDGEYTFEYSVSFSKDQATDVVWECGEDEYENTASFVTNDTDTTDDDSWTVDGSVICLCGLSQGYWFAKKGVTWTESLSIGGYVYTQAQGKAIWNSSNKGGITDAKKAFTQLSALKLSAAKQGLPIPAELQGYVNTINAFLTGKAKVTGNNITVKNAAVSAAANAISNWINENHCQ
jgi:hypothetical protein